MDKLLEKNFENNLKEVSGGALNVDVGALNANKNVDILDLSKDTTEVERHEDKQKVHVHVF